VTILETFFRLQDAAFGKIRQQKRSMIVSYIEQNLMKGETIVYRGKLHWVVFLWPVIWFFIAVVFFGGGDASPIGRMFLLIAALTGIASFIDYTTSEFGITNKRVIAKFGLIRRKSLEVLLSKVEGIEVSQGVLGRILGFGSITVSGTGGTRDPFRNIDAPFEFRKMAQEQIAAVQDLK
jgi:uncharacterized membrane protein YdbT with pleckstrin-like domain